MIYAALLLLAAPVPTLPAEMDVTGCWVFWHEDVEYTLYLRRDKSFSLSHVFNNTYTSWNGEWSLRGRTLVLGNGDGIDFYEISTRSTRNFLVTRHSGWLEKPRLTHLWREWR